MKTFIFIILLIFLISCSNSNQVYWCGDHPCINNKEKKAYFKKTMIVEIREINKKSGDERSEIEKITKQAHINEKIRIKEEKNIAKQIRLEEKIRIKEEKNIAKQMRLEEKIRIKEEKKIAKRARLDEKKIIKEEKKIIKQENISTKENSPKKDAKINTKIIRNTDSYDDFNKLVEKITNENILKPYPNINDIPH